MSRGWIYRSGDWNLLCDVCSKKIKASEAKKRWDGFIVCSDDYEERHPLDFARVTPDKIRVPYVRSQAADSFLIACTLAKKSGYVGHGGTGCMIVGNTTPSASILASL